MKGPPKAARCGAKTRQGGKCKGLGIMPSGRCRMHGGKGSGSPKGSRNALKHGIYSKALLPGEEEIWDQVGVGSIDDEIRIAKLQLFRAKKAQMELDSERAREKGLEGAEAPSHFELSEIKHAPETEHGDGKTTTWKRPDYNRIIYELMGRISDMELKRAMIMQSTGQTGGSATDQAAAIRDALQQIEAVTDGGDSNP